MLVLLALTLQVSLGCSQWTGCEAECEPLDSLLSECALPPVSDAWNSEMKKRNVTRSAPVNEWTGSGPETWVLETFSEAECFCIDFRDKDLVCGRCMGREHGLDAMGMDGWDESLNMLRDCQAFGYFDSTELAYPSTTRTSLPSRTHKPFEAEGESCDDVCSVIRAQIQECGLSPLEHGELPEGESVTSDEGGREHWAQVLKNRKDAECMCTLPVLRQFKGCSDCSDAGPTREEGERWEKIRIYHNECSEMGYWTDSEQVMYEDEGDNPTSSQAAEGSSPSSDYKEDEGGRNSVGPTLASSFLAGLFLLY